MRILALETATTVCGAALMENGVLCAERELLQQNAHAENIMRLIDEVLMTAGCSPASVQAIGVSAGPGSFTGLRIGFSVAKGLAYALDKKLVTIPTLFALAFRAVESGSVNEDVVVAAIDARRDEVYCSCYRVTGMMPVWENEALTLDELGQRLDTTPFAITGDACGKVQATIGGTAVALPFSRCSASTIAALAETAALAGEATDPASAEPLYVKEFYTKANQHAGY